MAKWAEKKQLQISTQKSTTTLFTSDVRQSYLDPHITLNSALLPLDRRPKILGVVLDTHLTFSPHISDVTGRVISRLRILKALAGSSWGQHKETLTLTFKSIIRSLYTYAAPIWFPNSSPSSIAKLQRTQNTALRIASGSHQISSIPHLHQETKVIPVFDHLTLLCKQFLVNALRPNHPSHGVVTNTHNPRARSSPIRHTLRDKFFPGIEHVIAGGISTRDDYDEAISTLHTECVSSVLRGYPDNPVLCARTPDIDPSEELLPRAYRTTLSQLRSGYSKHLMSFKHIIGDAPSPLCPSCGEEEHTTCHLFDCSSHPTELVARDLWERPGRVAQYLESLPYFDLPALARPPPEPPPLHP